MVASGFSLLALIVIALIALDTWYLWHFFPNTQIGGIPVGNMTLSAASNQLKSLESPEDFTITFSSNTISVDAQASQLGAHFDLEKIVEKSMQNQQRLATVERILNILHSSQNSIQTPLITKLDEQLVTDFIKQLAKKVDSPGEFPKAHLGNSGKESTLKIEPGLLGEVVDVVATVQSVSTNPPKAVEVVFKEDGLVLNEDQLKTAYLRASGLIGQQIVFKDENLRIEVIFDDQELVSILAFPNGFNYVELTALIEEKTSKYNQEPQSAVFNYSKGTLEIEEFIPDEPGVLVNQALVQSQIEQDVRKILEADNNDKQINTSATGETIVEVAEESSFSHPLPLTTTKPEITLADTNNIGIQTLIGLGKSSYAHSIPTRIHNVSLATQKITNTIVAPGEEFSFNKTIGDVSRSTGFQPAYVIKNGQTILGDGGGVCQVSTTLFRAALNTGLNITRRLPHSYRVGYYEQDTKPGIDATVYSGDTDLRFINDSPGHILIRGEADSTNLTMFFEIYGTDDGRTTEITDHLNWGYSPAPAPIYQVDPSLPPGAKKQVDWSAPGLKAKFTNVVRDKNGEVIREQTFNSNYIPWSAKFLIGPEN